MVGCGPGTGRSMIRDGREGRQLALPERSGWRAFLGSPGRQAWLDHRTSRVAPAATAAPRVGGPLPVFMSSFSSCCC